MIGTPDFLIVIGVSCAISLSQTISTVFATWIVTCKTLFTPRLVREKTIFMRTTTSFLKIHEAMKPQRRKATLGNDSNAAHRAKRLHGYRKNVLPRADSARFVSKLV